MTFLKLTPISLATWLVCLLYSSGANAQNLIKNGDFATGDLSGWTTTETAPVTIAYDDTDGSVKFARNDASGAANGNYLYQVIAVTVGESYKIDADWKGDLLNGATGRSWAEVFVSFSSSDSATPENIVYKKATDGGPNDDPMPWEWESILESPNGEATEEGIFEATEQFMVVGFNLGGRDASRNAGPAFYNLDNVSVTPIAPNLLVNGNFSTDDFTGWTTTVTAPVTASVESFDGSFAVMARNDATESTNENFIYQIIPVTFGESYQFNAEWQGDLLNGATGRSWAEVFISFVPNTEALPEVVMYKKATDGGPNDLPMPWGWESVLDSPNNVDSPADGIFTATDNFMLVGFNLGGRDAASGAGAAFLGFDNVSVSPLTSLLPTQPDLTAFKFFPEGGWQYAYDGSSADAGTGEFTALDGTWTHDSGSDEWDGSPIGSNNPNARPGGAITITEESETFLRIQDSGNPTGFGFADPGSNRKVAFQTTAGLGESPLDDGVTLYFRTRVATTGPLDDLHPTDGGDVIPWPEGGDGYTIHDGGKGAVSIKQSNGGIISFSLDNALTGLAMNSLNGTTVSAEVDTGEGTANIVDVGDATAWHDVWVTITAGGAGTHQVSIYLDGSFEPTVFDVTAGDGDDLEGTSYLYVGHGNTGESGAFDLDFVRVAPGVLVPGDPADSDSDGLLDEWELANFGNLDATANEDPDSDKVSNSEEFALGTNPTLADTDGDGSSDGEELAASTDPLDANSVPRILQPGDLVLVSTADGQGADVQMTEQSDNFGNGETISARSNTAGDRNEIVVFKFDLSEFNLSSIQRVKLNMINHRPEADKLINIYGVNAGTVAPQEGLNGAPLTTETWDEQNLTTFGSMPGLLASDGDIKTQSIDTDNVTLLGTLMVGSALEGEVLTMDVPALTSYIQDYTGSSVTFLLAATNGSNGQFRIATKESLGTETGLLTDEEGTGKLAPYLAFDVASNGPTGAYTSAPAAGWQFFYDGSTADYGTAGFDALDGTWTHDSGSDAWDGSIIGVPEAEGIAGGAMVITEGNTTYLRIQDTGDPRDHGVAGDPSNRKVAFHHPAALSDSALDSGVTLYFRARVAKSGPLDRTHPDGGGDLTPWPLEGDGYVIHDGGKGTFSVKQASGGIISFSFNDELTGLTMNGLNGTELSENVNTGQGTENILSVGDATSWHDVWITIQAGGAGTHQVSVYLNGSTAPTVFDVTAGTGDDLTGTSYLYVGHGATPETGAFDLDFINIAEGVFTPRVAVPSGPQPIVSLDATGLPEGDITIWENSGTLEGDFIANQGPKVITVDGVKGIDFDGIAYFEGPASVPGIEGASPRTVEAWVHNPEILNEETVVAWSRRQGPDGTNEAFNHGFSESFGAVGHWGDDADIGWNGAQEENKWTHIAYSYDGTTIKVFTNGELSNSKEAALDTAGGNGILVGAQREGDNVTVTESLRATMTIAKVRIYEDVLSDEQIAARFQSESSMFGSGNTVVDTPGFAITEVSRDASGNVNLSFPTDVGSDYTVQFSETLETWTDIGTIPGDGNPRSLTDEDRTRVARETGFYRVITQ